MVYIYILKLDSDKYYIGKTENPDIRLTSHYNSVGSKWTQKYKPVKIHQIIPDCDNYDEDKYTKMYMDKYGIDNLRGGSYVKIKLNNVTKKYLQQMNRGTNDKCFKCFSYLVFIPYNPYLHSFFVNSGECQTKTSSVNCLVSISSNI